MQKILTSLRHVPGAIPGPHRVRALLHSPRYLHLTFVPLISARRIGELFAESWAQLYSKVATRTLPQAQDQPLRKQIKPRRVIEINAGTQFSRRAKQRNRRLYLSGDQQQLSFEVTALLSLQLDAERHDNKQQNAEAHSKNHARIVS